MSDCSTKAMMPKERRTCGTCRYFSRFWYMCKIEFDNKHVTIDNPACDRYELVADGLDERYEHLAQVAREMYSTLGAALGVLSTVRIPRQNNKTSFSLHTFKCAERYISFHDELEALGVKLDGD